MGLFATLSARQTHQEKHKEKNRAELKVGVIYLPRRSLRESQWATAAGSGMASIYRFQNKRGLAGASEIKGYVSEEKGLPSCLLLFPLLADARNYLLIMVVTGDICSCILSHGGCSGPAPGASRSPLPHAQRDVHGSFAPRKQKQRKH